LRGSILINQLASKVYTHYNLYKSKTSCFQTFGNYL